MWTYHSNPLLYIVCLQFDLTLPGFNQYCRELMCLAQAHNTMTPVGIEPRTSRFGVRRSTTTPPHFLSTFLYWNETTHRNHLWDPACPWYSLVTVVLGVIALHPVRSSLRPDLWGNQCSVYFWMDLQIKRRGRSLSGTISEWVGKYVLLKSAFEYSIVLNWSPRTGLVIMTLSLELWK